MVGALSFESLRKLELYKQMPSIMLLRHFSTNGIYFGYFLKKHDGLDEFLHIRE